MDTYDYDDCEIVINKTNGSGKCAIYLADGKYSVAQSIIRLKCSNKTLTKYGYYYLLCNKDKLENLYEGTNQKQLSLESLKLYEIPIPPKEIQEQIVEKCDVITQCRAILNQSMTQLQSVINIYNNTYVKQLMQDTDNVKTLGEICELVKGKHSSEKTNKFDHGDITFISKNIKKPIWTDVEDLQGENVFIYAAFNGNGKCRVLYNDGRCAYSNLLYHLKLIPIVNAKYVYYYILHNYIDIIQNTCDKGTANKSLDIEVFNKIPIPIPTLNIQKNIVEHLDKKHALLESINNNVNSLNTDINNVLNYYI
jgi:restriction endonuclease S subunit